MKIKNVIVALDSFKGSLSSMEAGNALAEGIREFDSDINIKVYSIADGGEGSIEALYQNCGGELHKVLVHDPLFRPIYAEYLVLNDGTVIIEMAKSSGLTLLEKNQRNPLKTSSFGTGELIKHALDHGAKKIILTLGGSATNDAGIGMLSALGVQFLDMNNEILKGRGEDLANIRKIDHSSIHPNLSDCNFIIASDVKNPLYGREGAAYVYARQKGADDKMVQQLDSYLIHFANIIRSEFNKDIAHVNGAGAAGGVGAGLLAFTNLEFRSGIDVILDQIDFDQHLSDTDIIFVGEGQLDQQTANGKAPVGIALRAKRRKIPVIAIGGAIDNDPVNLHDSGITAYFSIIAQPITLEKAMSVEESRKGLIRQGRELTALLSL